MINKYKYYYDVKKRRDSYKPMKPINLSALKQVGMIIYLATGCIAYVMVFMCFADIAIKAMV